MSDDEPHIPVNDVEYATVKLKIDQLKLTNIKLVGFVRQMQSGLIKSE